MVQWQRLPILSRATSVRSRLGVPRVHGSHRAAHMQAMTTSDTSRVAPPKPTFVQSVLTRRIGVMVLAFYVVRVVLNLVIDHRADLLPTIVGAVIFGLILSTWDYVAGRRRT